MLHSTGWKPVPHVVLRHPPRTGSSNASWLAFTGRRRPAHAENTLARIRRWRDDGLPGARVVATVSAMGDTTDTLLELASQVSSHPHPRELDMLLTAGERISMALLAMALESKGFSPGSKRTFYYESRMHGKDWAVLVVSGLLLLAFLLVRNLFQDAGVRRVTYSEFKDAVRQERATAWLARSKASAGTFDFLSRAA